MAHPHILFRNCVTIASDHFVDTGELPFVLLSTIP